MSSNDRQKTAIRALIQDVPEWLEQQPDLKIKYDLQKINKDDLTSVMIGLWGRKLGSERSIPLKGE
jgi:hypothetical protein